MKNPSTIERARERLRLLEIYNTFSVYFLEIVLDRGLLGDFRRWMQQWIFRPSKPLVPLSLPVKIRLLIQSLGPTFIKMGQIVSSRSEALPPEWQRELNRLQSNVPPFSSEQVQAIILEELGAPPEEIYATFDPEPFAAASTAQVHRATLADGAQVVVKVQRPRIREQMKADLGIMRNAVRVAERRAEWVRNIDLHGMLDEFGSNALTELDYRGEAYNAHRLGENMADTPGVHVPRVYPFLSTSKVLTQEYIEGVKIINLEAIDAASLDRHALAEASLRAMIKQLLIDGFFHGDPHPGNVLVNLETGVIAFIDLGMMGELTVQRRIGLIRLLMVTNQRDARGMAQVVRSLSIPYRGAVDTAAFDRAFEHRISRFWMPGMPDDFSTVMDTSFDMLQEYGLRLDSQLTLALKALMQAEAISSRLAMKGQVVSMAVKVIQEQATELITADNIIRVAKKEGTYILGEIFDRLPTLQEATMKWLDQYEKGQLTVKIDATELTESLEKTQSIGHYIIIGIMLAGMIIGSAIAASTPVITGKIWEFMLKLALMGYTFAMFLATVVVIMLLWRIMRGGEERRR